VVRYCSGHPSDAGCHGRSPSSGRPQRSYFPDVEKSGWSITRGRREEAHRDGVDLVKCRNIGASEAPRPQADLCYGAIGPPSPDSVFATYRLRFGIETSYRQMHEGGPDRRGARRCDAVRGDRAGLRNSGCAATTRSCRAPPGGRVISLERLRWGRCCCGAPCPSRRPIGVADVTYTEEMWIELRSSDRRIAFGTTESPADSFRCRPGNPCVRPGRPLRLASGVTPTS